MIDDNEQTLISSQIPNPNKSQVTDDPTVQIEPSKNDSTPTMRPKNTNLDHTQPLGTTQNRIDKAKKEFQQYESDVQELARLFVVFLNKTLLAGHSLNPSLVRNRLYGMFIQSLNSEQSNLDIARQVPIEYLVEAANNLEPKPSDDLLQLLNGLKSNGPLSILQ